MATQAERSGSTREKLLDAAIATLIERGHAGASLPEICRRAGVSRGAQLHHFPTRADLLAAAVEHLFALRHREFRERLARLTTMEEALEAAWRAWTGGPYYAWLELVVAARTDPALREALARVDRRFEEEAAATLSRVYPLPPGVSAPAAVRLVVSVFDGLATNHVLRDPDDPQAREVLALAVALIGRRLART